LGGSVRDEGDPAQRYTSTVKAYPSTIPRIGIVVDLLEKQGVNAVGGGGVKDGGKLAAGTIDIV
jgi:hypothetical protein